MGVKSRVLPGFLDEVLDAEAPPGSTVVDLMTGTGVVAAYCARGRRVFANDAADYSLAIARSFIVHRPESRDGFLRSLDFDRDLGAIRARNLAALEAAYEAPLAREDEILDRYRAGERGARWCRDYRHFLAEPGSLHGAPAVGPGKRGLYSGAAALIAEDAILRRRADPAVEPACLTTAYYANVYFGLRQALVIDSLRAAVLALPERGPHAEEKRAHYLSALLHAASLATSGTSHFAQPRHLDKDSELEAMARRRLIAVEDLCREFSGQIAAFVAATPFVPGNSCFRGDYRGFIEEPGEDHVGGGRPRFRFPADPDLIYLDPPYTQDNYSRFYHVLDVLARYDYPPLERNARGEVLRGRYPDIARRFQSGFTRRACVEGEFRRVIAAAAGAGARLVISYAAPTGLLLKVHAEAGRGDPEAGLERLCREAYRDVESRKLPLMHSGQGDSNLAIEELLVICRRPR
jgi:hypothetical protein